MCNPIVFAAAMATMSVVQSIMQTNAQNELAESQVEAANKAASFDYQQLALEKSEEDEAAMHDKLQRQLQTAREHSRVMVAQGEAGVSGNSTLRVLNNVLMQGSYDTGVIEANRASKARQIQAQVESVHSTNVGRVNQAEASTVSPGMGLFQAGMAGISGGTSGYSLGSSFSNPFKGRTMPLDDNAKLGKSWNTISSW
jgi:hypothetical protein